MRAAQQLHARSVEVLEAIDGPVPSAWQSSVDDIRRQRVRLAAPDALARVAWSDVPNLVRFMAALGLRARKLRTAGPARDAASMAEVARWEDELARAEASLAAEGGDPGVLAPFRALVEEYRVSLFAQELRTPLPVSVKRLHKVWESMQR